MTEDQVFKHESTGAILIQNIIALLKKIATSLNIILL